MSRTLRTTDFTTGPSYEEQLRKRALKHSKNHKRDGNMTKTSLRSTVGEVDRDQFEDDQETSTLYC